MRLLAPVFLLGLLVGAALEKSTNSPFITLRRSTAVVIDVKEVSCSGAAKATAVLKNDIELSGFLSLGDSASATITISGTAPGSGFSGQATEKGGSVVLQKSYSSDSRRAVHQFIDDLIETVAGQKGIATSRIAFVANRTGHKENYVADYYGSNPVQFTHDI